MAVIDGTVEKNGYSFWLEVTESVPSDYVDKNYTYVSVRVILQNGNNRTNSNGWVFEINVNGGNVLYLTEQNLNSTVVSYHESFLVTSVSKVKVPHNPDGSKTVDISAALARDYYSSYDPGRCSASGNVVLTNIPRASGVSVSSEPILGGNAVTISCSSFSENFRHTIKILNPDDNSVIEKFEGIKNNKDWIPALFNDDTPSIYATLIPKESRQFIVTCTTFNGTTQIGTKQCTTTIHVPNQNNTRPTMNGGEFNYTDSNSVASAWGVLVQTKSKLNFALEPVCKAASHLASGSINIDGNTYTNKAEDGIVNIQMTKAILSSGNLKIKGNATDSRGFRISELDDPLEWFDLQTVNVIPYISPSFEIQPILSRCNSDGSLNDIGEYIALTFKGRVSAVSPDSSTHKNTTALLSIKWKEKEGTTWPSGNIVNIAGVYNSSSDDYIFEKNSWVLSNDSGNIQLDQSKEYNFRFELIDAFNTSSNPILFTSQLGVGGDLLNFNESGNSIGIGQLSTAGPDEHKMEVALDTVFKSMPSIGSKSLPDALISSFIDIFYPVGSYYETSDTTFNPNTAWGGTWVEDSKGRFTLANGIPSANTDSFFGAMSGTQYNAGVGSLGGQDFHVLSLDEMPSHNHGSKSLTGSATNLMWDDGRSGGIVASGIFSVGGWTRNRSWTGTSGDASRALNVNATHTHSSNGGGQKHNNMPPYVGVKRWHRTA